MRTRLPSLIFIASTLVLLPVTGFAADPGCVPSAEICNDGIDNDCDGKVDCADRRSCRRDATCADGGQGPKEATQRACYDGRDNDKDGFVDCLDPDCRCICGCPEIYSPVCGVDGVTYPNECEAICAGVEIAYRGECVDICGGIAGFPCPEGQTCNMVDPGCQTADLAGVCVPTPDACAQVYDPVCGCDGVTYGNDCERLRAGAVLDHKGECSCICPEIYDPVCGVDGKTYENACFARCAGVEVAHRGVCGQMCGGIAGIPCPEGQACLHVDPTCSIIDDAGTCVSVSDVCLAITLYDPVCGCDGITYPSLCELVRAGETLAYRGECCDDGTLPFCLIAIPLDCPPGTVQAVQNHCWVCVDPVTCEPASR